MIIYFRVCEKQETISHVTRFGNVDKKDMIKRCWKSLQSSVEPSDSIIVIYDSVSEDTIEFLKSTSNTVNFELVEVPTHSWDYHQHTVTLIDVLEQKASEYPEELHFILEDDYLHVPNALKVLRLALKKWEGFAVPYDYIDRYLNIESTSIILGPDRHWRLVNSSTMTVVAKGKTWLTAIPVLRAAAPTSNDAVFSDLYQTINCIAPLPGVSSHMTDKHLTPYIDWQELWDMYNE